MFQCTYLSIQKSCILLLLTVATQVTRIYILDTLFSNSPEFIHYARLCRYAQNYPNKFDETIVREEGSCGKI